MKLTTFRNYTLVHVGPYNNKFTLIRWRYGILHAPLLPSPTVCPLVFLGCYCDGQSFVFNSDFVRGPKTQRACGRGFGPYRATAVSSLFGATWREDVRQSVLTRPTTFRPAFFLLRGTEQTRIDGASTSVLSATSLS